MISSAICDYLDVTTSPDSEVSRNVLDLVLASGTNFRTEEKGGVRSSLVGLGDGVVRLDCTSKFHRVSASGGALAFLRGAGLIRAYLEAIASDDHRVTRLDAAVDTSEDGADVVQRLRRRYRRGRGVPLCQRSLKATVLLGPRASDGRETGTFYAGHRSKARVTARVYDKAHEQFENRGVESPPWTRYELTVRRDVGVTLRDALEPSPVFWQFMAPALIARPRDLDVPAWEPGRELGWDTVTRTLEPAERIKRMLERSSMVEDLLSIADELGPNGRKYLVRQFGNRCGLELPPLGDAVDLRILESQESDS